MNNKCALITGIYGQDGSYLAELLLEKEYRVIGVDRLAPEDSHPLTNHLTGKIELRQVDLMDQMSIIRVIKEFMPDEIYNFAANSFIPLSWEEPIITAEINALGVTRILEAIRSLKPEVKFYQASSSEMFGKPVMMPQNESSPFIPQTPYGTSKLYAHWITSNYRHKHDIYACSGILYNHESPRRGKQFVTRKITAAVAAISLGLQEKLVLGNLDAKRDWGYAKDYVKAMWLMLQQDQADDYIIATGREHSVKDCVEVAFDHLGLDWQKYVEINQKFIRPVEPCRLVGDSSKAQKVLNWHPSVSFDEMIKEMVDYDLTLLKNK